MPLFELARQRHEAGQFAEAEALYRQILAAQPNHAEALHLLGVIAHQTGRHDLAVESIRQSLVLNPANPFAHSNLGEAFRTMGRLDEAIAAYRRAIQLKPHYPEAHYNLGIALQAKGQFTEAIANYRHAIELKPDHAQAHNNLGIVLAAQGQPDEAMAAFRRAIQLKPGYPQAHNNLGASLAARGQLDEAIVEHRRAIELSPSYAQAHNNLGIALAGRRQFDEAGAAFHRALEFKPGYPEACLNLGNALGESGRLDDSIAAFHRALELRPDYSEAHLNLGSALTERGQIDEALAAYRRAILLKPDRPLAHSNLIYTLHFHPDHTAATISEERRRWNRQFSDPLKQSILPHINDPNPERPLRIGYVSPDFREHVVGRYLLPLFENHDRQNFEILCYSGVVRPDRLTDTFRHHSNQWRNTLGVSDEALADIIRQDAIDILVDLSQHMAGNRLPVFARKPAPVQVSFAGYPESTGLEAIEYRISDPHLEGEPTDEKAVGNERVCVIDSFWCYDPCGMEMDVNSLPALQSGIVTFGCLNNFCKVNDRVLRLWARVLGKVKNSRLLISSPAGSHRQTTLNTLQREGVEADRVEFVGFRPWRDYLELYHRLDIVLDTFPYNGGVTTCDALWMGVPVLTLPGATSVSRAGLSLLSSIGLPEFAASSEEDYVRIAEELAADLSHLADLRATLRARMQSSPLMDAPRFAQNIEAAYRAMWRRFLSMNDE